MKLDHAFQQFDAQLREFIRRTRATGRQSEDLPSDDPAFNELALNLFALQFEHNRPFHQFCRARGASSISHWTQIPALPTSAFKEWEVTCLPAGTRTAVFLSSGTTGQTPGRQFHHEASLALYGASLIPWFRRHLLPDEPTRGGASPLFLSLTPSPGSAPHSSLVHMFAVIAEEQKQPNAMFAGGLDREGNWVVDTNRAAERLRQSEREQRPALLLGTAFSFVHLLEYLEAKGERFRLPARSRVLETGGYKGRSRALPRADLHTWISRTLGIEPHSIVCEYGMSELSSQAYDHIAGQPFQDDQRVFRFPPWARARLISPETGLEVADGQQGLIQVFDLANAWSVLAIQTDDIGIRRQSGFELLGRAAHAEPRGCSLMTSQISPR